MLWDMPVRQPECAFQVASVFWVGLYAVCCLSVVLPLAVHCAGSAIPCVSRHALIGCVGRCTTRLRKVVRPSLKLGR